MKDLFGKEVDAPPAKLTQEYIKKKQLDARREARRRYAKPRGYAWEPGTGPEGETCQTCQHMVRVRMSKTYRKCGKNRAAWTGSGKTDILARSPACKFWEKITTPQEET